MKGFYSILILITFLLAPGCGTQKAKPRIIQVPFTSSHRDPGQAHLGANDFAKKVGDLLKEHYPSKVTQPQVTLTINKSKGEEMFHFSYTCYVVPTTPDKAQTIFDRRGTILSGATADEAKNKVSTQITNSNKVVELQEAFQKKYGNYFMPDEFVKDSASQSQDGKFWYVKEYFITALDADSPYLR